MTAERPPFDWIEPDWPAPGNVRALCTTRSGGVSTGPWSSMNLGSRCGDDPAAVSLNRARLCEFLPGPPVWLQQVHGADVVDYDAQVKEEAVADAIVSRRAGEVCAVQTADCLPVLFCNRAGTRVGAAHAGWRGLAAGVLEATARKLECSPDDILCWLGPAIGPGAYEVGRDVVDAFSGSFPRGFSPRNDRWLMDLHELARMKLESIGIQSVSGGDFCTYSDPERFFSYRRDGQSGRMACMVWMS